MSRMYNYVRSRELEGTFPGNHSTGVWPITSLRIGRGWGTPTEEAWPYKGRAEDWPPIEPKNIDNAAKASRILMYQGIRSVDDCKIAITKGRPITASFLIDAAEWGGPNIPLPPKADLLSAGHCISIVGFDDNTEKIEFLNSWGESWGDNGFGRMDYEYFERYLTEAWTIPPGGVVGGQAVKPLRD